MPITLTKTDRGFTLGHFLDRYGYGCSIQESSLATENCLWLGADEINSAPGCEPNNRRIHLTREMAAELVPLLRYFIRTGELPKPD